MQQLLNENDVALQLSVTKAALRRWRLEGRGPRFLKLGSLVRYQQNDISAWLQTCPVGGGDHKRGGE